ncbi:MAG TPA: hypothetical protein VF383_01560 [Candidatus Dormibacteraeota bacterium]
MKRRFFAFALMTLLSCACGAAPAATTGHSPSVSGAPVAAASGVLSCRLPVGGFAPPAPKGQPGDGANGQASQKGRGGFLDLPSGKFTPAADSDQAYVAGANAWVPVSPQSISPDQRSYVETRTPQSSLTPPTTTLYIVQVGTKIERKLFRPADGQMAFVLAYTSRGVYVGTASSTGPGAFGFLIIDPATGASRPVPGVKPAQGTNQVGYLGISGDFAWELLIGGSQTQQSLQMIRISLADGSTSAWYEGTTPFFVVGFDSDGHPIVGNFGSTPGQQINLFLLPAPKQMVAIQQKGGAFLPGQGGSVRDAHGTWFGSADGGIWLYSSAKGMEEVAIVPPQPGGTGQPYDPYAWRSVAGPCL